MRQRSTPPPAARPLTLSLAAEAMGSGLVNVRWNPESALIGKAQSGRLVIKEGDQQPRTVNMALTELKTGHLLYQSPEERLEFRLETVELSGASNGETIIVLSPKSAPSSAPSATSPLTGQTPPAPQAPASPPRAAAPTPVSSVTPAPAPPAQLAPDAVPPSNPAAPKPAPRTFSIPVQKRPDPGAGGVILDDPGTLPTGAAPVSLPSASLPGQLSAPPPPEAAPSPPRAGGALQPAVLVRKIAPVYPPLAKAARIQGSVRFSGTVGKDGHLQNLQVLGGHSALVQAATDAVKQWVYRPTLLNGEPVEVITQLEVNFTLSESR